MDGLKKQLIRILCTEESKEEFFKLIARAFDMNTERLSTDQDVYAALVAEMTEYFQMDDVDILIYFAMGFINGIAVGEIIAAKSVEETKTE